MAGTQAAGWLGIEPGHPFGLQTLPFGTFTTLDRPTEPRTGVAIGDRVLDLSAATDRLLSGRAHLFSSGSLDAFLDAGDRAWDQIRRAITRWLSQDEYRDAIRDLLVPAESAMLRLPFTVADYVDFYASEHHASNVGRIFRPGGEPLTPNWRHVPIGYHGRSSSVIVSGTLHVYISQTDRGELVFGASVDPFTSYSMRGSLEFIEGLAGHVLELMPALTKVRLLRQWAGLCDMTPDFSPVMGPTPVDGFLVDVGWGTYGFKAGPVSGEAMAQCIASGRTPEIIAAFGLDRFADGALVGEKGAAAVGH